MVVIMIQTVVLEQLIKGMLVALDNKGQEVTAERVVAAVHLL